MMNRAAVRSIEGSGYEGESSSVPLLTSHTVMTHAVRPRQLPTDHAHAVTNPRIIRMIIVAASPSIDPTAAPELNGETIIKETSSV